MILRVQVCPGTRYDSTRHVQYDSCELLTGWYTDVSINDSSHCNHDIVYVTLILLSL